jgi:uncharacterized protein involved in outer membrane biogenesis
MTLAEAFDAYGDTELDLKPLGLVDADLALEVAHWQSVPGDVRNVRVRLRTDAGRLAAPVAASIAGAHFEGEIALDGTSAPPQLRARLGTREAPLADLAALVFDVPYVRGSVDRFDLTLDSRGTTASELVRALEAQLRVEGASFT